VVVAGAALLFVETLRLRRQVTQLQAEKQAGQNLQQSLEAERKRNEELNARLDQEKQQREQTDESLRQLTETPEAKNPAPPPVIASLTLLPGLSRGGGQKPTLDLSSAARLVRLQIGIDPEEQYKSFAVELRTLAGRQVWNRENLAGFLEPAQVCQCHQRDQRDRQLDAIGIEDANRRCDCRDCRRHADGNS